MASSGVVRGQNSALQGGGTVGGNRKGGGDGGEVSDIAHSSYSRRQILSDTQQYFPSNDISLLPHLPAGKKLLEEQIF